MNLKIAILYQSYGKSYGHTRMAHNLALAAQKRGHEPILINSGIAQNEFMFHPEIPCLCLQDFKEIRSYIATHQTDLLITEFFPFGRASLRPKMRRLFESLKEINPQLKIVSSMREFVGRTPEPKEPNKLEKHARRIAYDLDKFYDLFLIHGPTNLKPSFDVVLDENLLDTKGKWCGYLVDPYLQLIGGEERSGEQLIVGFGAEVDPLPIYEIFTSPSFGLLDETTFIFSHPAQRELLARATGVSASSFRKSFPFDLQTARLAILYAGYGTVIERLLSGLPTIFISRENDLEHERRLDSIKHLPHIRTIKHNELNAEVIKEYIHQLKDFSLHQYNDQINFNAGEVALEYLEQLF